MPPSLLLGFLAPSYLLAHRLGHDLAGAARDAGVWSEEIFRGDRLPSLPFPDPDQLD
ncbi:MAG: hypothetical protein VKJ86_05995 [Synechococcus sp.]|nr:hypothetical protein [Synechococcus sp.]